MRNRTASLLVLAAFLLASLALFSGCGEESTPVQSAPAPDTDPYFAQNLGADHAGGLWARYYPLRVGNHWRSEREFRVWDDEGVIDDITGESTREIIGHEELLGRTYTVEEWTLTEDIDGDVHTTTYWIRYRQDRDGLYEADVAIGLPPTLLAPAGKEDQRRTLTASAWNDDGAVQAMVRNVKDPARRAAVAAHLERHRRLVAAALFGVSAANASPADLEDGEITRLVYPLRRGQAWVIRPEPLFTAAAEGHELLRLPIGWRVGVRVRITPPGIGPDDEVFMWYSSCGMLRLHVFLKTEKVDPNGQPLGTFFYSEETVDLGEADVLGRPWCGR